MGTRRGLLAAGGSVGLGNLENAVPFNVADVFSAGGRSNKCVKR